MLVVCTCVEAKIALKSFLWMCVRNIADFIIIQLKLAVSPVRWKMKNSRLLKSMCCTVAAILASYADVINFHAFFSVEMK